MAARLPGVLPTRDDLGQMPSARTGRNIARIDIDAMGAPGRGIAAIGEGLASLGASLQQQQDQSESQDVERRLLEFEQQQARALDESRRTLTGDPSGFADSTREGFTEAGRGAFAQAREAGLSDRALQRLATGLSGMRDRFHTRAFTHELDQRGRYGEEWASTRLGELNRDYTVAPDDQARDRILRDAERTVELGRRTYGFTPEAERRLRSASQQMIENDALTRPDSYAALLDLREGDRRVSTPSTGQISELGLSQLEQSARRPDMTPAQVREAQTRLREQTGALSQLIQSELKEGVNLTQAQHDALVSFGVARGEAALKELLPRLNSGDMAGVTAAMRGPADWATAYGRELNAELGIEGAAREGAARVEAGQQPGPVDIRPVEGRTPVGARARQGSIEGIVLHHTSGSSLEGALSTNRFARTGYNYYIDRDGSIHQFAPDNQAMSHIMPPGSSARIAGAWSNLSSDNTIGISVVAQNDGDVTDAQRAAMRNLTGHLAAQYGIKPENIVGHGDLQTTRERTEGSMAREFREGRTRLAQRGGTANDATPSPTPAERPDPRIEEYADLMEGRAPAGRYARLPVDRRRVLIGRLEQALRPQVMADMDDDLELIRQTGQDRRLPDGTTSFSRGARILTGNQMQRYLARREEALTQYRALNGLQDMSPDEIAARREQLNPGPAQQSGERLSIMTRTRTMFDAAVDKMREAGERDPAQSVEGGITLPRVGRRRGRETIGPDGQPILTGETDIDHRLAPAREVAEAHALIRRRPDSRLLTIGTDQNGALTVSPVDDGPEATKARQDAWRIIIDARLAAQARRGIPEHLRAPITRAEAAQLLSMPQRVADDTQFENMMRAAADRAEALYGPYARDALAAAIRFRANISNEQSRIAGDLIQRVVNGSGVRPEEVQRMARAMELSREEQAWLGRPTVLTPSRSFTDVTGIGPMTVGPGGGSLFPAPAPQGGWFGSTPSQMGGPVPSVSPEQASDSQVRMAMQRAVGYGQPASAASQPSRRPAARQPEPPPEEIQYLQQHPQIWREFDRDYGPGAAARYLQQLPQP